MKNRNPMKYDNYSAADFAADEYFIKWVKHPDDESEQFWQQWLAAHPSRQIIIEQAMALVKAVRFRLDSDTQERTVITWQRIQETLRLVQNKTNQEAQVRPLLPRRQSWYWAAAVIGVLVFSAILFRWYTQSYPVAYQTAFGETKEIQLPDGSTVILNANSMLTLGKAWEQKREVWLQGEAFFSVKKQESQATPTGLSRYIKFVVHTPDVQVEVLGTEFNVTRRKENTVIVLNSGKIKLRQDSRSEEIIMKPGDWVEINKTSPFVRKTVNPELYRAWTNKEWVLENTTLVQIANRIEETYGVKVIIRDSVAAQEAVTGVVPTENLELLVQAVETAFDVRVTRNKNQLVIE